MGKTGLTTDSWEREEQRKWKERESVYEDRIPKYWEDLTYHQVVTCSKEDEDRALAEDLYMIRKLKEKFRTNI